MRIFKNINDSWALVSLGAITSSILYGMNEKATSNKNGIPFIRITDINENGRLKLDGLKYIPSNTPNIAKYQLIKGDILIARSGSVGLSYLHKSDDELTAYASYLIRFRLNQELIIPEYLQFYLRSAMYWNYVERVSRGATILNINSKQLSKLPIPLPTLPEQQKIVEILKQAEHLKALRNISDEKIKKLKSDLFYDFFLKDQIALKSWEKIPLVKMTTKVTSGSRGWGKYYSDIGARFIRVQDISDGEVNSDKPQMITPPATAAKERSLILPDDILISIVGSVGKIALFPNDIGEAYVSQNVAILRLDSEYSSLYTSMYLDHPIGGRKDILRLIYGQTQPTIGLNHLEKIRIPIPPLSLIEKFKAAYNEYSEINTNAGISFKYINNLIENLKIKAFTGELTNSFRKKQKTILSSETKLRDETLKIKSVSESSIQIEEAVELPKNINSYLSSIQQELLNSLETGEGYVLAENDFNELNMPSNQIERNLDLLAEIGLIKSVNIAIAPGEIGNVFYTSAYRSLTEQDNSKEVDLESLEKETKI